VRQGQQNRRGRGRNNNRKGHHHHNPLSRSFESNGPDVKIRGTPAHIAEKYLALARDAQSSGDPVLAENYLQHAEHYSRIIMAYREQLNPQGAEGLNGNSHRMRSPGDMGDGGDDYGDEEGADGGDDAFGQPFSQPPQQPMRQDSRQDMRQDARPDQNPRHDGNRPDRPFRRDQGRHRERFNDRGPDRERPVPSEARPQSPDRQTEQSAETPNDPRRRDRFQQPHEQPEFLRRPVRRVRSEVEEVEKDETSRD
jgi:Domain of unknown function (DUF4167)